MDGRIEEAFLRCWLELITEKSGLLPMEPSTFQNEYLALYADSQFKLNLKESSYKKVMIIRKIYFLDWKAIGANGQRRCNLVQISK